MPHVTPAPKTLGYPSAFGAPPWPDGNTRAHRQDRQSGHRAVSGIADIAPVRIHPAQLRRAPPDDEGCADTEPFVRGIRLAWWSTGPGCGPTDDSSAPCWSVYSEDRLTGRLTPCGN